MLKKVSRLLAINAWKIIELVILLVIIAYIVSLFIDDLKQVAKKGPPNLSSSDSKNNVDTRINISSIVSLSFSTNSRGMHGYTRSSIRFRSRKKPPPKPVITELDGNVVEGGVSNGYDVFCIINRKRGIPCGRLMRIYTTSFLLPSFNAIFIHKTNRAGIARFEVLGLDLNNNTLLVGYVLGESSTRNIRFVLTRDGEDLLVEGILVIVDSAKSRTRFLVRVDSIVPFSDLYSEDSPFILAKKENIPLDFSHEIDRAYMVAEATVLGCLRNGLREARRPPAPGDPVYLFDPQKDLHAIYGADIGDPGIIWLYSVLGYHNFPLALDVENLTMHMGIFGVTGSGKSYSTGVLIEKLSRIPAETKNGEKIEVALPVIVIDANADYVDYHLEYNASGKLGAFYEVHRFVFPHSPVRTAMNTRIIKINLNEFTTRELAELIMAYKTGGIGDLPELQVSGLDRALQEVINEGYDDLSDLFVNNINVLYNKITELSSGKDAVIHPATARAIRSAIDKFYNDVVVNMKLISKKPTIDSAYIDDIVNKPKLVIIDFSPEGAPGISLPIKQLIVGYLTRILYKKFTEYKIQMKEKYLLLIIEEAQNYLPSRSYPVSASVARSYLSLIATQGRKFGIILGLVSQRPSFVDPIVVSMINTFFIFRIGPEDVNYVMKLSGGLPESLRKRITRLARGTAIVLGQMNMMKQPVIIEFEKRSVPHRMGTTNLIGSLIQTYTEDPEL